MSKRKLVSLRKVKKIMPIDNADFIELCIVDGWQCIVKKGEFKENDLGVFFEIDSFLPIEPRYEFLRKGCFKRTITGNEGFLLRTMKLRKKLSQGLLLPLIIFPELNENDIDLDLSEKLNVIKYEKPIPAQLRGVVKGNFPSFISKTDEERIQNLLDYFDLYKDIEFEETEKQDGTSGTYYHNGGEFGICSRNLELKEDENNTYWKIAKELNIFESLKNINQNIAIQGEIVGEGIAKNPLLLKGQELHVFNVYDIDKKRHLTPNERFIFLEQLENVKVKHVPVITEKIKIFQEFDNVNALLEHAKGLCLSNPKQQREGIVFKANVLDDNNQLISFKVINNDYLLGEK